MSATITSGYFALHLLVVCSISRSRNFCARIMTEGQSSFRTIATCTECSEANGSTYLTGSSRGIEALEVVEHGGLTCHTHVYRQATRERNAWPTWYVNHL
ncbi:hypothetical protein C8R48DRAFT_436296 [Suillus tomentosus]|nr:hypothetical protein C8R48DRAFT_436296 [Suillus tomentosus]